MTTIKLTSHYNGTELKIRLTDYKAAELLTHDNAMELINEDIDRAHSGYPTKFLSAYQCQVVDNYLSGTEYFDRVCKA